MLSSHAEPNWYSTNQAKFISELNIDNLRELTQKLQEMINNRIAYFTNNPQKLVVKIIGLEQYIIKYDK